MTRPIRRRTILYWTFGLVIALAIVLGSYIDVARWLGCGPFGAHVVGRVVSKNIVTYQGRATRVDYIVHVRTSGGSIEAVKVPESIYKAVGVGWELERRGSAVTATSTDGSHSVISVTQY